MSRESVAELYRVRIELEGMAAAMAPIHVTSAEIAELEVLISSMTQAVAKGEDELFLRANRAFHFTVYRCARSFHLMPMIESLWLKFGPLLSVPLGPEAGAESRVINGGQHHHLDALHGLEAGDGAAVARAIRNDLSQTADWFAAHYDPKAYLASRRGH